MTDAAPAFHDFRCLQVGWGVGSKALGEGNPGHDLPQVQTEGQRQQHGVGHSHVEGEPVEDPVAGQEGANDLQ